LAGTFDAFADSRGTWRCSTKDLSEGEYVVKVTVRTGNGTVLIEHDDWFEKRVFHWMRTPRGAGPEIPTGYTPLAIEQHRDGAVSIRPWGRDYALGQAGLPVRVRSQENNLLAAPVELAAEIDGKTRALKSAKLEKKLKLTTAGNGRTIKGTSRLRFGDLSVELRVDAEYDGLLRYHLTYGPSGREPLALDALRLRVPLTGKHCRFYSASGDRLGTNILGDVLPPPENGRVVYSSDRDTYAVTCHPTFATLFWVGDYETCFCYAADTAEGWVLRDDAAAVTARWESGVLALYLNLVDRRIDLDKPRTLEFAFQAGPVRQLPKGWRGVQFGGDPANAPVALKQIGGSGYTLAGGCNVIHPGTTAEQHQRSHDRVTKESRSGRYTILGYHRWPAVVKGLPETRVFRSEWGIDRFAWESARAPNKWQWQNRFHGENKDLYIMFLIPPVQSYVDFITYAQDEAMKYTDLQGFYDDTGYPVAVYDEELGAGYIDDRGRQRSSSGLWVYRERWKRAEQVNAEHGRPNYLCDSQHVHAHYLPAYAPIGIWAPCERGFYNPFPNVDNLEFYKSLERYYAINPSHAFGQIPSIGMSTPEKLYAEQSKDTRCMVMMTMLHDQDVGSFGHRDLRTVARLRRARNVFEPWKDDVTFTGFWNVEDVVQCTPETVRVSVYRRPGSVLFVLGNIGDNAAVAHVVPDWAKLGVRRPAEAIDPETHQSVAVSEDAFQIDVPRHDIRLVLAGNLSAYNLEATQPESGLPGPEKVIAELCDSLAGPELGNAWQEDLHEGTSSIGFVADKLFVQASHYGYGHVRRRLDIDNVSVQCMILRKGSGQSDEWAGGISLHWDNGAFVRLMPGNQTGKFLWQVDGHGARKGNVNANREPLPGWYPFYANWLKIRLTAKTIEFHGSNNGSTWANVHDLPRDAKLNGAPAWVVLGNGNNGPVSLLKNPHPKHFIADRGDHVVFFSDFVVGR